MKLNYSISKINQSNFKKILLKVVNYRSLSPAQYLYNEIIKHKDKKINEKLNSDFILLIYVTLQAWNMNDRGAKLSTFTNFKKSIFSYQDYFTQLDCYTIYDLDKKCYDILEHLFNKLNLVQTNAKLVTFSKTMHFMFPELIVPIDNKYTLKYYHKQVPKKEQNQFELFKLLHKDFKNFANQYNLSQYIPKNHQNLSFFTTGAKNIDNLIIGAQL